MKRIGYIDSMRGLAMTFVVMGHVFIHSGINADSFISSILLGILSLPLFFVISGFLSVKDDADNVVLCKNLLKKIPTLIIAPLICMAFYCGFIDVDVISALKGGVKAGYWFTISLFEFITVYYCFEAVIRFFKIEPRGRLLALLLFTLVMMCIIPVLDGYVYKNMYSLYQVLGLHYFHFFVYFLIGVLIRRNFDLITKLNKESWFMSSIILVFVLIWTYQNKLDWFKGFGILQYGLHYVVTICGLLLTFSLFQRWPLLSDDSWVGKSLKVIGRHSLEIYFLHYFFLDMPLGMIGAFFTANPSPLLVFLVGLVLAVPVTTASLILGKILRLSPFISKYMFGQK